MLNPADGAFVAHLKSLLPPACFRDLTPGYLEEPRSLYQGMGGVLATPGSVQEVATIITECAQAHVGVVPYGGGTGLVGGQVQTDGVAPVILSLERMNTIRAVYPSENVIVADAGVILADLQAAAEGEDRLFPLSLASEGSARIGGNLATNAGGVNVLRYGNTRDLCLGLEAVLPDGSIWNGLSRLRKDNTGYDLRNLLIGSEGTLGIITGAALRLFPRPRQMATALLVVRDPSAALELLTIAGNHVGPAVTTFELMEQTGMSFLTETGVIDRPPFDPWPHWMVLIELSMGDNANPTDAMEMIFTEALDKGLVSDGLIAQSQGQAQDFWKVRESLPEGNKRIGAVASHDISLPLSVIPEFFVRARQAMQAIGPFRINGFGHLGDGNLHFNIFPPKGHSRDEYRDLKPTVTRTIHDLVAEYDGSISAEHGIGRMKVADLQRYGDPAKLAAMRAIKAALDPAGIMNPGAVLPAGQN